MRMSEKGHNNDSDNPLTTHRTDKGKKEKDYEGIRQVIVNDVVPLL